ncbi:MAG: ComF family protein [Planctomycetes bacterium]|nr:ComF family protein [Planctomycetota bacterium]
MLISPAKSLVSGIFDLLLPRHCAVTGRPLAPDERGCISAEAARAIRLAAADYCSRCGAPQGPGVGVVSVCGRCKDFKDGFGTSEVVAVGDYEGSLREMCLALKFGGARAVARPLAAWLVAALIDRGIDKKIDVIAPVPLHAMREFGRGYNQSALIANQVAKALRKPMLPRLVARTRATERNALLDVPTRRKNVEGAFAVRKRMAARIKGKSVLVVDDVMTTGATIAEAARVLTKAGAGDVFAAVAARSTVGADSA